LGNRSFFRIKDENGYFGQLINKARGYLCDQEKKERMPVDLEKRYCQSCGMPLDLAKVEYLGTNENQTSSHEFCYYCLKDGQYTVDYSMQEMVDVWVKYTDKYNWYTGTAYKPEELRSLLMKRLPTLSRWKQKEETENVHFEIINRVLVYINRHLFEVADTTVLADVAGLSLYYFRRIFKEVTGENVGSYIQRLRLEYIAYKLITTDSSLMKLLKSVPVYTKSSLSKAFRKHFGLSPTEYRVRHRLSDETEYTGRELNIQPDIKRLQPLHIIYLQVGDAYSHPEKYRNLWSRLTRFAAGNKLTSPSNKYLSLSMDEPVITLREQCRFFLGITADQTIDPHGPFGAMEIPGGLYAVFRFRGSHKSLPAIYRDIYLHWLPANGYRQREPLTFEMYQNTPRQVPATGLITDIYIPIEKKKTEAL